MSKYSTSCTLALGSTLWELSSFGIISINIMSPSSSLAQMSSALGDGGTNPSDSMSELNLRTFSIMNEIDGSGVTEIILLGFEGKPLTSCFIGTRGSIVNKVLFRVFHAILNVMGTTSDFTWGSDFIHLGRLCQSKMSFHQELNLIFELD
ncbi:hypothetical protein Tco_0652428 [Tanacetum coccineum]|uniref:Uncharacterized protein n=1 Tax=Tanacetum coccineum TaxID=301880 RepID=A0ABQ4WXM4_9ASTR